MNPVQPFSAFRRARRTIPGASRALVAALAFGGALLAATRPAHADAWALLIGIDQYEDTNHISSLGGASADARALAKTLHDAAGFPTDHVKLLVSDGQVKPTRNNILNELTRLSRNAKPGDTVFVLYSGHGVDIDGTPYLLPYDTSALSDADITDTALETSKFRGRLRQVKAGALILAFDMCRSDPRKSGKDITAHDNKLSRSLARGLDFGKAAGNAGPVSSASAPIAVTLYSCTEGERSYEWQDKGRGYFSYYLEEGLKGAAANAAGQVTVGGLARYVGNRVKTSVQNEEHHTQTPYPSLDGPGAAEFVLAHSGRPVAVVPAGPTVVTTILDTAAHLKVMVDAPNATVLVDGQPVASGRETVFELGLEKTKTVEVGVKADGYKSRVQTVVLSRGVLLPLSIHLVAVAVPAPPPDSGPHKTRTEELQAKVRGILFPRFPIRRGRSNGGVKATGTADLLALLPRLVQEARKTADGIRDAIRKGSALATVVTAQAQIGDVSGARRVADGIGDPSMKAVALCNLATVQAETGDVAGAEKTAARVGEDRASLLRASALPAIVLARTQDGDSAGARLAIGAIHEPGEKAPSLIALAQGQARLGDTVGAQATLDEARRDAAAVSLAPLRASTFASLAVVQAQAGDVAGAKSAAMRIGNAAATAVALAAIGAAQARAGDRDGARATIESATQAAGEISDPLARAAALSAIGSADAQAGDIAEAKAIAESIGVVSLRAATLSLIAAAQAKADDRAGAKATLESARLLAEGIEDPLTRAQTLAGIAAAIGKASRPE